MIVKTLCNKTEAFVKSVSYAPSQAHLQGTQSQHTKANLAKEPALFPRFLDTPYFGGHIHYSDTPERRANVQQGVWQNTGGRKPCFNFCVSIWLHIQQDVINLAKCKSSTINYKFSFSTPGLTEFYYPYFAKPCSLCATLCDTAISNLPTQNETRND